MKKISVILVCCLMLLTCGCASKTVEEQILGTWKFTEFTGEKSDEIMSQVPDFDWTLTFYEDGTVKSELTQTNSTTTERGTYILSGDMIELNSDEESLGMINGKMTFVYEIKGRTFTISFENQKNFIEGLDTMIFKK